METPLKLPIQIPLERIEDFCKQNDINKLSLFGSVLRDDFTSQSDVDLLVEFLEGKIPGLRTAAELSRFFRERVLQEAVVIYAKD
jgi:uncharacterized protein